MKTIISKLVIAMLLAFVVFSCNKKENSELIKIGSTLDFTGPNAVYGEQVKEGLDLAVEYINDSINNGKKTIEIEYLDSKSNDVNAINNAHRLISLEGVKFIIGEIASNATKAMIPTIEGNDAFLFAPASSGPILTNISNRFARNWPSDDLEAGFASKYAIEKFKCNKPIILYVNSDYGKGLKDKFIKDLISAKKNILDTISFEVNQTDYKTIIGKIKQKNPDCIYLAGNPKEMGRFMKQTREQNYTCNIISNTGFLQPDCLNLAQDAANNVIVPTPKSSDNNYTIKSVLLFQKLFKLKYKKEPTLVNANAFDAIVLLYESIKTNGYNPSKVALDIRNKKGFKGASGIANFTNGEIQTEIIYMKIVNKKPVEIVE